MEEERGRDAFTGCCCITCGLYLKGSGVGSTFLKECFISGQPLTKEVIFGTKFSLDAYGGLR